MAILKDNVVMMQRKSQDDRTVADGITRFLNRHLQGDKTTNTYDEYKRDINRFFSVLWGKQQDQLEIKHLDILPMHIEEYVLHLKGMGYKSATIKRNIDSVRALYGFFQSNKYRYKSEDGEWIYILQDIFKSVNVSLKDDAETYGIYTHQEIQELINRAKKLENGFRKSLAIELASITSFRLEAIVSLNIKTDFRQENSVWVAKTIDKGKPHEKAIDQDLYNRLLEMSDRDGKLFPFTSRTMQRTIDTLNEEMGLDPDRNLVFHSIKKYGIQEVFYMSKGNAKAMAEQGNHSSYETTHKYYTNFEKDYSKMPSLMIGKELDFKRLEQMNAEQLLNLIKSASRSTQYELIHDAERGKIKK